MKQEDVKFPAEPQHHENGKPPSPWKVWVGVLIALLIIFVACASFWRIVWLRPYLAAAGGGMAAFLGPIPGLLSAETRDRWLLAAVIAAFIALGTWFTTNDLDAKRQDMEAQRNTLQKILDGDDSSLETVVSSLSPTDQDKIFLLMADRFFHLYRGGEYPALNNLTHCMLGVRPMNGHALYFAGEAFRALRRRGDMLSVFKNYLYEADQDRQEAYDGSRDDCYRRPNGYCAERTAYVNDLMANDAYVQAERLQGARKFGELNEALSSVRYTLAIRSCGFNSDQTIQSSSTLLEDIAKELKELGQDPSEATALLAQIRKARAANCPTKMPRPSADTHAATQ